MQKLKSKTALPTIDKINKRLQEIQLKREEGPNETILPEYEINGVMVPIFLLKECAEGNIEEDSLINAIETGDFSGFSDWMCVHLLGDDLDFEDDETEYQIIHYVIEDKNAIWALYCRYDLWIDEWVAIQYIENNQLKVAYVHSSDLEELSDTYYKVNKFIDVNF